MVSKIINPFITNPARQTMRLQLITTAFALYPHSSKNLERGRFPTTFAQEVVSPTIKKAPTSALNMGMGKAAAEVVLKDFSKDAASWFGGVRTPASFIMGSSLGALFTMTGKLKGENSDKLSTPEYILVQMYQVLILGAFVLSLSTVVFATAANVQVMYGDFNPMATNGYSLLKREFEFPFVTARLGFLGSLILFIISVFIRALLECKFTCVHLCKTIEINEQKLCSLHTFGSLI